jgi:hypothetical protein
MEKVFANVGDITREITGLFEVLIINYVAKIQNTIQN